MATKIQIRRDTSTNWTAANPILAEGELGIETDTVSVKLGDGVTRWVSLAYWDPGAGVTLAPATTVVTQTTAGASSTVGASLLYARGDHAHGTPPLQTTVSGNAGTVTNATLTTALTVNTGTVTLIGNAANTSVLTLGAGASSVAGNNTGDQSGATPALTLGTSNIAGSATTFIKSDATIAAFDATAPSTQAFGDTAVVGTAVVSARRDHKHAMPASPTISDATISTTDITTNDASTTKHGFLVKATAPASGLLNVVGIGNGETVYTNKALFDATVPSTQAFGDSAATGSATVAARRDHKHAMPAAPTYLPPRVTTITSHATPTINTDTCDAVTITAQAEAITSMTTNLTGTPNNFDKLTIRIKDNGTARAITWGTSFVACGVALPTTTVLSKVLTVGFVYDSVKTKWCCVASIQEA